MKRTARWIVSGLLCLVLVVVAAPAFAASKTAAPKTAGTVDVNNASAAQLETLPGVGPSTAQKIIAGRPYASMDDLKAKTKMSDATAAKLNGHVTFGPGGAAPAMAAPAPAAPAAAGSTAGSSAPAGSASSSHHGQGKGHSSGGGHAKEAQSGGPSSGGGASSKSEHKKAPAGPVDINTATPGELESLPGVGPSTANKIIAGRPYASTADLAKLHLPKATMDKIMPSVTASPVAGAAARPVAAAPAAAPAPAPAPAKSPHAAPASGKPETEAQAPPAKGMVWVNLDSKVYHYEGDQWYGRTKNGKFMTEQDAIAAGCRAAKKGGHKDGDKDEDKGEDKRDR